MLYLFSGNSEYLLDQQVNGWKTKFVEKNGDFDLVHIKDLKEVDNNFLIENLTAGSLFDSKKLIIIDNLPLSSTEKGVDYKAKQDFIQSNIDKVPESNIVLFKSISPDKRSKFYKELSKKAEHKEFNIKDESDAISIVTNKYNGKISQSAAGLIVRYKSSNLNKISMELDKLLIAFDYIEDKHIKDNIVPELEESIFQFIDDLLNINLKEAFTKLDIILEQTNIYGFYNNLIANLRVQTFIEKLKKSGKNQKQITDILALGNRGFLVNKRYRVSQEKLQSLYIDLVNLDKKMKTGNMIGSEDEVFIGEIKKCILKIKSNI